MNVHAIRDHEPTTAPAEAGGSEPGRAVVAAVDTSRRSGAAVAWAAAEASATGRPLQLVHVVDERTVPVPFHSLRTEDQYGWQILDDVAAGVREQYPRLVVRTELRTGDVADTLVGRAAHQSSLVVGRRGAGTFLRLLIGNTSLAVAGRANVPVVVVPDAWDPSAHVDEPIVLGVDHRDLQHAAIRYAFVEAQRRGVPLVAAHGREVPAVDWTPDTAVAPVDAQHDHDSAAALEEVLAPYREAFPGVSVTQLHRTGHPLTVLLDDAGPTQLVVVGRHSGRGRGDFPFGSVTRGVLHYANVPVAVVPPQVG